MIAEENVLYLRFILLLIQGGTELLRKITKKALTKMKTALRPFLSSIQTKLTRSENLSKKQKELLYPSANSDPDVKDFDITLLSFLILNCFGDVLDGNERNAAKQIRDIRNKYHAHVSDPSMTKATYTKEWTTVLNIIFSVAHGMPDEDKNKLLDIINNVTDDQFELATIVEKLKEFDTSNDFYSCIKEKLDEITTDVKDIKAEQIRQREEQTKQREEQLKQREKQIRQREEQIKQRELIAVVDTRSLETEKEVLELRKELSALKRQGRIPRLKMSRMVKFTLMQKTTEETESYFLRASKESIKQANKDEYSPSKLKEKTDGFIADVEKLNVKVTRVKDGSVALEFTCSSLDALIDLLDYFCSTCFSARLDDIAKALEHVVGKKVDLFGFIDLESLRNVIKKLHHLEHERIVQFEMECDGVVGLLHVLEVFEEDKTANSLNELSKALSEKKPVTLHTSINIDQMHRAIDSLKKHIALENANEIDRRNDSCSADKGLQGDIHNTIKSTDKKLPDESLAAELSELDKIGKSLADAKITFPDASQPHATMTSPGTKRPLFVDRPKEIFSEYPDDQNVLKEEVMESGQRENRQELSCLLCSILDYTGFNESIRKFRTEYYKQMSTELSRKNEYNDVLITGSGVEGADMPINSDLDLLYVFIFIYEDVICLSSHGTFQHLTTLKASESPEIPPGYVKVTATNFVNRSGIGLFFERSLLYQDSNGYPLVSSAMFRNYISQFLGTISTAGYDRLFTEFAGASGPASTFNTPSGRLDHVMAIYYYESSHLSNWSSRNAFRCWPCSDMIKEVSTTVGYIVPVGSLGGRFNSAEWRVSFTTSENRLLQSLNQSQFKLYIMLKMITKELIRPYFSCVSSYVIKNVVFWVCELSPRSFFRQELLIEQIAKSLKFIKICVYNNHLPNYFIPERNLLASRLEPCSKQNLITRLDYLIDQADTIYCRLQTFTKHSFLLTLGPSMKEAYRNKRDEIEKCELNVRLSVLKKCNRI